jgi:hypothetical protein
MKQLAVINGGDYTPLITETLALQDYEITEWETIPLVGGYDLILFFLEGIHAGDMRTIRQIKRAFLDYIDQHNSNWVMFAPQDSVRLRRAGVMRNHYRCILDACRFSFLYKKRFRCWSSFPMESVLCNRNCVLTRMCPFHDTDKWEGRKDEPLIAKRIELYKAYDKINVIPTGLLQHVIEMSKLVTNTSECIDNGK